MAPTLGYWNVRGLAQPIRNLLIYKGVNFEDKRYTFGPPPNFDRFDWHGEKHSLGLKFPSLPYYIDGNVRLTQSIAILRYLARKHDLAAKTDAETAELDMLEQQAKDLSWGLAMTALNPAFHEVRKKYEDSMANLLKPWADHLQGKTWVLGDRLTYVDFLLYEALDWNCLLKADAFSAFPVLLDYLRRFEELPNIKEHMASYNYSKWPLMGPMVKWGHKKE
ncbi:unnamed protein product [Ixodes pacificus]